MGTGTVRIDARALLPPPSVTLGRRLKRRDRRIGASGSSAPPVGAGNSCLEGPKRQDNSRDPSSVLGYPSGVPFAVDTKSPAAVEKHLAGGFAAVFKGRDLGEVRQVFRWVVDAFAGRNPEFHALDTPYHDLAHTLEVTVCLMTLIARRSARGVEPACSEETVRWALVASLLHDVGYLRAKDDTEGTGAKYTVVHVDRSSELAEVVTRSMGFGDAAARAIQGMIQCTALGVKVSTVAFDTLELAFLGKALGAADLLAQMAAPDYLDKLPLLFREFAESAQHQERFGRKGQTFESVEDLLAKTPGFWRFYALPRMETELEGVHRLLGDPVTGRNEYVEAIEANMARLSA